jgi:hypothetical protein
MAEVCPVCKEEIGFWQIDLGGVLVHSGCEATYLQDPEMFGGGASEKRDIIWDPQSTKEITYQGDEQYYLEATEELDSGEIDDAMWAKAMTLSQGNETKARYQYIELKAQRLNGFSRDPSTKIKIKTGVYKFLFWIIYIIFIIVSWISFAIKLPLENIYEMAGQLIGAGLAPLVLSGVVQFISNRTLKPEYPKRMWWKILTWITAILLIGNAASIS